MSHNLHLIVVIVLQRFLEEKFEEDQEGERERERERERDLQDSNYCRRR
jgi:hypothetical protein